MKVLVLGNGGREHAITWKLSKSKKVEKIFCCPGNAGTSKIATNITLSLKDFEKISDFVIENNIDLTIVGSEVPLSEGIVDFFKEKGLIIFGPSKEAAELESSKVFAKNFMRQYRIPTANYRIFKSSEKIQAIDYIRTQNFPLVIKANGLAAGKGVIIANSLTESEITINNIFEKNEFGSAGNQIVIEEFMQGMEASIFAITDGTNYIVLQPAQDHKRIFDDDKGKNTGGMGAYSPTKIVTKKILQEVCEKIIEPTLKGMESEGRKFTGCLYCGLMITSEGPKVVEYNCRFGDPETQVVLPLLKSDFFELLYYSATNDLSNYIVEFFDRTAVCIILSSEGYPDAYEKGKIISGLENINEEKDYSVVFHAGTKEKDGKIFSDGGRVLGITSFEESFDLKNAIDHAYSMVNKISFDGMYYRKDIGKKGL